MSSYDDEVSWPRLVDSADCTLNVLWPSGASPQGADDEDPVRGPELVARLLFTAVIPGRRDDCKAIKDVAERLFNWVFRLRQVMQSRRG